MIKIVKLTIVIISGIGLFGCGGSKGWFRDRSNDYVKAKSYPALKVPADTHSQTFSQEYQIPEN